MAKPSSKGQDGEIRVALDIATLDHAEYRAVHNVTVMVSDGTTQIDHVVLSKYGIFVVETKNYTGWIYGKEREKEWTRKSNGGANRFQNPIRQNHRHIKSLSELLGVEEHLFHSVIAFCGASEFKTPMPPCVLDGGYADYIRSKKLALFSEAELGALAEKLKSSMLERGEETDRIHLASLKQRFAEKETLALAVEGLRAKPTRPRLSIVGRQRTREIPGAHTPTDRPRRSKPISYARPAAMALSLAIVLFGVNGIFGGIGNIVSKSPPQLQDQTGMDLDGAGMESLQAPSPSPPPEAGTAITDADEPKRSKEAAWEHWYSPPPECENLTERNMVECGNENIRARQRFERLYAQGKVR